MTDAGTARVQEARSAFLSQLYNLTEDYSATGCCCNDKRCGYCVTVWKADAYAQAEGQRQALAAHRAQRIILAEACGAIRAARDLLEPVMNTGIGDSRAAAGWCEGADFRVVELEQEADALRARILAGGFEEAE